MLPQLSRRTSCISTLWWNSQKKEWTDGSERLSWTGLNTCSLNENYRDDVARNLLEHKCDQCSQNLTPWHFVITVVCCCIFKSLRTNKFVHARPYRSLKWIKVVLKKRVQCTVKYTCEQEFQFYWSTYFTRWFKALFTTYSEDRYYDKKKQLSPVQPTRRIRTAKRYK